MVSIYVTKCIFFDEKSENGHAHHPVFGTGLSGGSSLYRALEGEAVVAIILGPRRSCRDNLGGDWGRGLEALER